MEKVLEEVKKFLKENPGIDEVNFLDGLGLWGFKIQIIRNPPGWYTAPPPNSFPLKLKSLGG